MASWESFFGGLGGLGKSIVDYQASKQAGKIAVYDSVTERRRVENQKFEQEAAAKEKVINAYAQVQQQETLYQVATAIAVGLGAALIGAAIAQVLKAIKKRG